MKVFVDAQLELLCECLYGVKEGQNWTMFVEGREAILPTLRSLTAEEASSLGNETGPTIAAHAWHIRYMLQGANFHCGDGAQPEGDWNSSWARNDADPSEWTGLVDEIEDRFQRISSWISSQAEWNDPGVALGMSSLLPHLAYHLGAIRQLMRLKK